MSSAICSMSACGLRTSTGQCVRVSVSSTRSLQAGQALIIVLAFAAILGAGLFSIYNTAQLTTAKRKLVNAADASAYSGASVLAQGLNYTAYTNRAMLANNAMIGQMMAARSNLSMSQWYWKNNATVWKAIQGLTQFIPYIGQAVAGVAQGVSKFSDFWGNKVVYPTRMLAEVLQVSGTAAIGLSNQVMWLSQQVHLADSLAGFEPNMIKIAKDNAPDADVDWALHGTVFGPLVTLGQFASSFQPKVRKSSRTMGTNAAAKDQYLNYVAELNRTIAAPSWVQGRSLLPNAVGLWIATGCDAPPSAALAGLGGLFTKAEGFGETGDTIIRTVDTFASLLSLIANPIMCLYERNGGSELIQLEDGKMAWASVDAMAFKVPLIKWYIPFAGGSNISFTEKNKSQETFPSAMRYYEQRVLRSVLFPKMAPTDRMGMRPYRASDCVEYVMPGSWDMYAISTDTRVSSACAVLSTGWPKNTSKSGVWGGPLKDTARKIVRSKNGVQSTTDFVNTLTAPLEGMMSAASAELEAQLNLPAAQSPLLNSASGTVNAMPAGVSGAADGATTALPNAAGLAAAGSSLAGSAWLSGMSSVRSSLLGLTQRLNPANFMQLDAKKVLQAAIQGSAGGAGHDGHGPGWFAQIFLDALGLGGVVDLMKMKVSDGVEAPRNRALNNVFNVLADGLPPYFWDVRVQDPVQGRAPGEEEDLKITDGNPDDYNPRRYGLGPLVYLPLTKSLDKVRTAENTGLGGAKMGLPDFDGNRNVMRAIGKARVYFRQPNDKWLGIYKHATTSSLLLPYWQVRNENLSYVDKWGLMALDGVTNVISDAF